MPKDENLFYLGDLVVLPDEQKTTLKAKMDLLREILGETRFFLNGGAAVPINTEKGEELVRLPRYTISHLTFYFDPNGKLKVEVRDASSGFSRPKLHEFRLSKDVLKKLETAFHKEDRKIREV